MELSGRSYLIGISGRGQRVLRALDCMNAVNEFASDVIGRMDWNPDTPINSPNERIYKVSVVNPWSLLTYTTPCSFSELTACAFSLYRIRAT